MHWQDFARNQRIMRYLKAESCLRTRALDCEREQAVCDWSCGALCSLLSGQESWEMEFTVSTKVAAGAETDTTIFFCKLLTFYNRFLQRIHALIYILYVSHIYRSGALIELKHIYNICSVCFFFQLVELREDDRSSLTTAQKRRIDNDISSTSKCVFVETIKPKYLNNIAWC